MDKSAIKNYAVWARKKLIEDITQKAFENGITKDKITEAVPVSSDTVKVGGKLLQKAEAKQRQSLVERVREKGFSEVMEEVAYTWFNRLIAIRFMEVNEYLPTGVRVLSSIEPGKAVPDIVTNALHLDLDLDLDKVNAYLDAHNDDELFRYLFVKQCNKLNEILPYLFEKIEDYTELLLPNNLLIEGSVIKQLVEDISEDDFGEQVEIIGWLYQYYISEKKDEVFEGLKKNIKITKETIPAATQLFTPDWIVKYMVENSLGRLWLEGHPNEELQANWKYYLDQAEQEPEVQKLLDEIREKRKSLKPEEIKVLDPCMGSGHILVYAFDVLMEIYKSCGYAERDAAKLILQNNLYGLDIDDRAFQLAYFAVMMKARGYNRRILNESISPHLCGIQETNKYGKQVIRHIIDQTVLSFDKEELKANIDYLLDIFQDAKEYGSILNIQSLDYQKIEETLQRIAKDTFVDDIEILLPIVKQAVILAGKYDVVVTNPPYMSSKGMSNKLTEFVKKNYPITKSDLFSVFIEKCLNSATALGHVGLMTSYTWMFISSYSDLRYKLLKNYTITSLVQPEYHAFFEEAYVPICTFTLRNNHTGEKGEYVKLTDFYGAKQQPNKLKEAILNRNCGFRYSKNSAEFSKIPGTPIAYWVSDIEFLMFEKNQKIGDFYEARGGMTSGNNDLFVRHWYEVLFPKIGINLDNNEAKESDYVWFPYNKGGNFKRWYGNIDFVINWYRDGMAIKNYKLKQRETNPTYNTAIAALGSMFKPQISWSLVSSSSFGARYYPKGFLFDVAGSSLFVNETDELYLLAYLNTKIAHRHLQIINPTMNFQPGNIKSLVLIKNNINSVNSIVNQCINISKIDWDSFETSWDFKKHPLIQNKSLISECFKAWQEFTEKQFFQLKINEEELNEIFIDTYGLNGKITPKIEEKDITIRKADLHGDIRSFISYAVGCMLGRYSLDVEGLAYAGGDWDNNKYKAFIPDADNVIPITDDEYFNDDIVGRFIEFIKVAFGVDTLEENLDFIAKALGNKGDTSREVIRQYFIKDFYKDHVKTYQKKPIYWLFDSGKENGFKALIYMHRYDEFTVAKVRTDYLHRLQKMYEAEYKRCDILIDGNVSEHEEAVARKKKEKLQKQMQECLVYDQVIAHVANQRIKIDLDDGVSVNYAKFQGVEVPQGEGRKPVKMDLLARIG